MTGNRSRRTPIEEPIVRADAALRRKAVYVLLGLAIVGAVIILGMQSYVAQLRELSVDQPQLAARKATQVFRAILVLSSGTMFAGGVFLIRLSRRIRRAGQFPPPGMRVLRDTKTVTGTTARALALVMMITGVLSIATAIWFPIVFLNFADDLAAFAQ